MPSAIRSLPSPTKKRKLQDDSGFARSVEQLEDQLTLAVAQNSSLNPLADLLDLTLTASDPQHTSKAIYALYRVFVVIVTNGNLLGRGKDEATKVVKSWIWERLNEYVDFLGSLLKDEEKFLRVSLCCTPPHHLQIPTHPTFFIDLFSSNPLLPPKTPIHSLYQSPLHRLTQNPRPTPIPYIPLSQNLLLSPPLPALQTSNSSPTPIPKQ